MKFCISFLCSLLLLMAVAFAETPPGNWQVAYKDNISAFYFDTDSVRTVGSSDILIAELKTEMSPDMVQVLIEKCGEQYDTSSWGNIKYMVSSTKCNLKEKTLSSKNHRLYDAKGNLIGILPDEDVSSVPDGSVKSKVYMAISQWLYEN
ncbi:MAG: hypothetical protein ACRC7I_13955 [Selenomonadaceae bacterium]